MGSYCLKGPTDNTNNLVAECSRVGVRPHHVHGSYQSPLVQHWVVSLRWVQPCTSIETTHRVDFSIFGLGENDQYYVIYRE